MAHTTNSEPGQTEAFVIGSSRYLIAPEDGFRLMKWTLATAGSRSREILHWPEQAGETPFHKIRGGNPLLFPFSARTFDQGVQNFWRAPDGQRLPMPMHGFARDGTFLVTDKTSTQITGTLLPSEEARRAYPFDYLFSVTYAFEELAFTVLMELENREQVALPWSAGHHFYFNLPWHAGAARSHYRLNMEARKYAYQGPDGKLVMEKDREACHDFGDADLMDRIHWELRHNRISFGPKGGEEDVHLIVGDADPPPKGFTIVTWSESQEAPFYCVEPWMGPPNSPEHGKGLHWVGPGEKAGFKVQVSLY